jgi:Domain of unknown function (DUF222)/HNH endonuclease
VEVISMCQSPQEPVSVADALAMLDRALAALAATDAGSLATAVQAQALRALERAEARHTAARANILSAFTAQDGYEGDGQGSARTWLRWQTRVTKAAAAGAVGWARRLAAHPVIADALATGMISPSWARAICGWTDRLPEDGRDDGDTILFAAASGGAGLADLAGLAEEMYQRSRQGSPDDPGGGFDDRAVWFGVTFGGAARLNGDLTAGCAAALSAVLESLGKRAGPEDNRTAAQRRHDALEEACRRLITAGMLPARAGQPTQAQVHITLAQLRNLPGASDAEAAWRAAAAAEHGWLSGPAADAAACDATLAPIVTGHVDPTALDRMLEVFLTIHGLDTGAGLGLPGGCDSRPGPASGHKAAPCGCRCGGCTCPARRPLPEQTLARLRGSLLAMAADALSGPGGLASWLRHTLLAGGPAASQSLPLGVPLPLDIGQPEPAIPAHLRRAAATRHPRCAFPGCDHPASLCQIHHIIPRSEGGPTALNNLVPLCAFHHLIVIHRRGWTLRLLPDGTTTATSADGRTLHSHGPPGPASSKGRGKARPHADDTGPDPA